MNKLVKTQDSNITREAAEHNQNDVQSDYSEVLSFSGLNNNILTCLELDGLSSPETQASVLIGDS